MGLFLISDIKGLCLGAEDVKAAYIGSEQVWPVGSLPEWIEFADPEVLRVLLANGVDTDGDGGITEEEAAAVTDMGAWFDGNSIIGKFNEFEKFTSLTAIKGLTFRNTSSLIGIKIPSSIITIGKGAFYGSSITELDLKNVSTIEDSYQSSGVSYGVFGKCTSLEKIYGGNLKYVGKNSFNGCSLLSEIPSLRTVTSIGDYAFMDTTELTVDIDLSGLSVLNPRIFENSGIRSVKFGQPTTTIGAQSSGTFRSPFYNCMNLQHVYGIEYLTVICKNLFYNCTSLAIEDLSLPNLETLGQNAFYGVKIKKISNLGKLTTLPDAGTATQNFGDKSVLEEVVLPDTLTSIPNGSFYQYINCVIEDLNLPNLTTLGGGAFNGTKLRRITSLGSVTQLAANASNTGATFYKCTELTHIEQSVLDKLTFIATAFNGCSNLEIEELKLPGLEGTITPGFVGCNKIKKVTDLGNITSYFGDTALNNSTKPFGENVELIVIPKSVQSIGRYGFANFNNTLKTIIVNPTTPPQCAAYWAAAMPSDTIFYVPDASVEAYKTASGWVDYADRIKPLSEYVES